MNKATIYISGIIGQDTTLTDVIRQYKSYKDATSVEAIINSPGGNVDQGQSIYTYLRNIGLPITTVAEKAYSIAASIFMAGDTRIVMEGEKVLMAHMPFADKVSGGSSVLEAYSKQLKEIEKSFVDFYSLYLELDKDTIRNLLESEIFLSSKEAIELGFAHEVTAPLQAVAYYETETTVKNNMTITDTLAAIAKKLNIKTDTSIVALVLQDVAGVEINFPDLAEGDKPEVGDKGEIDGSPASGEFKMPEGETYVFEAGEITEIKEAVTEEKESEILGESQIAEVSKWEFSIVEETFEIGTQLHYRPEEGEDPVTVQAGEYELEDGRRVLTDSDGIIRFIKEKEGEEAPTQIDALMEKVEALYGKKLADQEAEIVALKKLIGTTDIEITEQAQQPTNRTKTTNYLR
ncbi:Clp protease ClpP [Allomuricauda taeanensis]|uniref:Clp protease ClpP n=1 Tax=Flagellimonas taeanensis TaxID=1005926 RepID=UPI002E7B25FD|nr:Clp protease ClpP [Allomuricauda taeanensis]MEE1963563.1 Clp protease ClpP [Allomuricauda taeanensis]